MLSYPVDSYLFSTTTLFLETEFSAQSKGVFFFLSPLYSQGYSIRTDLASDQSALAPINTIIRSN